MANSNAGVRPTDDLTNWQIALLALYTLGGATSRQHGEDVALKCYEMAPRRFSWEKYKYPHLELVRSALRDAKKEKHGVMVSGAALPSGSCTTRTGAAPTRARITGQSSPRTECWGA